MQYSKSIMLKENFDVVVCGGGFSGFSAAYSAAREGAKVIIIERNSSLGGVGTNSLVNHILGVRLHEDGTIFTCVDGLFGILEKSLVARGGGIDINTVDLNLPPHGWFTSLGSGFIFDNEKMKLMLEEMLVSVGVKILYQTDIIDVTMDNTRVNSVIVHNKSGLYAIGGKYFVDATGDADICTYAGNEVRKGNEEGLTAPPTLELHLENVDHEVLTNYMKSTNDLRLRSIIKKLNDAGEWDIDSDIFVSVMLTQKDVFLINTIQLLGVDGTDADSISQAVIDGRQKSFHLHEIAKKYFPGFENSTVRSIAPTLGIRETNRIMGEYTLTVEDLTSAKDFEDGIALSGYGWDLSNPDGKNDLSSIEEKARSHVKQIPYRCLIPNNLHNVIVAGRCISVERLVMGPLRVMGPCIAMGEAAGIATAMALEANCNYNQVNTDLLRQRIIHYGGLVDRKQVCTFKHI